MPVPKCPPAKIRLGKITYFLYDICLKLAGNEAKIWEINKEKIISENILELGKSVWLKTLRYFIV